MGDRGSAHRVMVGRLEEKDHLEDLRVDGNKILKWNFRKWS